jgi:hypothetical protein
VVLVVVLAVMVLAGMVSVVLALACLTGARAGARAA